MQSLALILKIAESQRHLVFIRGSLINNKVDLYESIYKKNSINFDTVIKLNKITVV